MSRNPFTANEAVPNRLAAQDGAAIRRAAAEFVDKGAISGLDAAQLAARFGVNQDELLLHILPLAQAMARPLISDFHVGAVGRAAGSGDLIFGANLEFPGSSLHYTLHGEGFVAIRAWQRGQTLEVLAIGEAHPCAHCRQVLVEFAASDRLTLIDPLGHRLKLEQLYPWPFDPAYLGRSGVDPSASAQGRFRAPPGLPQGVALELERAGREAHAPYSGSPSALVLEIPSGLFAGGVLESVAFNPTQEPVQTALVALVANGGDPASISRAWLAQPSQGSVDLAPSTAALLGAIAPAAKLSAHQWSV